MTDKEKAMDDEKKYYRYEFVFDSKKLEIRELDYYDNETLNETDVFINNHGVYKFYMISDSKDNIDTFLFQISKILSHEMHVASNFFHLASGRFADFDSFWKEYDENNRRK